MGVYKIDQVAHANGQALSPFSLEGLPVKEPGGHSYLRRWILDREYTDIDVGAGGGVTTVELHNVLARFECNDGRHTWGPENLDGVKMAAVDFLATGEFSTSHGAEGDDAMAANDSNEVRRIINFFDYGAFGAKETDFAPPCSALKGGAVKVSTSALPTNATAIVGTYTLYAETCPAPEIRAVARIIAKSFAVPANDFALGFSGRLLLFALQNSADQVDADLTDLWLYADGMPLMDAVEIDVLPRKDYANTEITSALLQRNFCEPVGGTDPRVTVVYPMRPREPIGNLPPARSYKVRLAGGETATNYEAIIVYAEELPREEAVQQIAKCGCNIVDIHQAIASKGADGVFGWKTASKMPLKRPDLMGYLPLKLQDPELFAKIGG